MKQILAIQKEIIKLQDENLTPFKFLETTYDRASIVRDRLNKAAKDTYKQTSNFSKLNKQRANTVAWWSSLLEIATDTIENLEQLPLDCKLAIKYAIASKKLPKNYVRRKTEQLLEETRQAALKSIEPQQPKPLHEEILVQYREPESNNWVETEYQSPQPMTLEDAIKHHSIPLPDGYIFINCDKPVSPAHSGTKIIFVSGNIPQATPTDSPQKQPESTPTATPVKKHNLTKGTKVKLTSNPDGPSGLIVAKIRGKRKVDWGDKVRWEQVKDLLPQK